MGVPVSLAPVSFPPRHGAGGGLGRVVHSQPEPPRGHREGGGGDRGSFLEKDGALGQEEAGNSRQPLDISCLGNTPLDSHFALTPPPPSTSECSFHLPVLRGAAQGAGALGAATLAYLPGVF